jgi:hypothetical protein
MSEEQLHATLNMATLLVVAGGMVWASLWGYMK